MILYFENSHGIRREIARPENEKEVNKVIQKFLKDHCYHSYYTRCWINPENKNETYYDVGSHSEFFILAK